VGDGGHNTVERFNADTGAHVDTFIKGSKSLDGPRGMLFDGDGHFLVANQNVNRGKPGEIMEYDAGTGAFVGEVVPFQDANAPFAPRGIVLKDHVLYVANFTSGNTDKAGVAPDGNVARYDATTGQFLGNLAPPTGFPGQFNPRGIAFGPDGKLYVSVMDSSNLSAGHIVQFDVGAGTSSIFAANDGDGVNEPGEAVDLHRPEGLTFGPDGRLYVTSFRSNANDIDRVLVLDGTTGAQSDSINLDQVGQPRAYAQSIVFGPGGALYVPISGNGPDTGAIRSYDVTTKSFSNFEAPGTLTEAWYVTFGSTDPATLAYHPAAAAPLSANVSAAVASAVQGVSPASPSTSAASNVTTGVQTTVTSRPTSATSSVAQAQPDSTLAKLNAVASWHARDAVLADNSWLKTISDDLLAQLTAAA
jgi:hypothetical protein